MKFDRANRIPEDDVYEVVASKASIPEVRELKNADFAELATDEARYFAGSHYQPVEGKKAYLVRAVYGHGGTGQYEVFRNGSAIWVHHGSLGHTDAAHRSAFVINLAFRPTAVYRTVSIAE